MVAILEIAHHKPKHRTRFPRLGAEIERTPPSALHRLPGRLRQSVEATLDDIGHRVGAWDFVNLLGLTFFVLGLTFIVQPFAKMFEESEVMLPSQTEWLLRFGRTPALHLAAWLLVFALIRKLLPGRDQACSRANPLVLIGVIAAGFAVIALFMPLIEDINKL